MKKDIKKTIQSLVIEALVAISIKADEANLERPAELAHGDYSSNIALALAKEQNANPRELAVRIAAEIERMRTEDSQKKEADQRFAAVMHVEVAGPGFINFTLSKQFYADEVAHILKEKTKYGQTARLAGRKTIIEHTDPNPFKAFHIGHLMSNSIGESVSRLIEASGADVVRANYSGDVGLHVARAIYGMMHLKGEMPTIASSRTLTDEQLSTVVSFLGKAYAAGATLDGENEAAHEQIVLINKKVYEKSDPEINALYDLGRKWSLAHFEHIYKLLGTKFDRYFFESEVAGEGKRIVESNIKNGIFEVSNSAVVFHGEKYSVSGSGIAERSNLHTRVFITKDGLPTYEAKEIGLTKKKFDTVNPDLSIVITANEQSDYFKVVLKAIEQIYPEIAAKSRHISHGMLVLPSGKMSSRTGKVITGESLILDTIEQVGQKMLEGGKADAKVARQVAVAAIKYSMLRQVPGKDIVYDMAKSLSLEGDSGPYLQYATVRAQSVLEKAKAHGIKASAKLSQSDAGPSGVGRSSDAAGEISVLERLLARFPEVVMAAAEQLHPSDVATYLVQLSSAFNGYYAKEQIVSDAPEAAYRVALTTAFTYVMSAGLWMLGIEVPESM